MKGLIVLWLLWCSLHSLLITTPMHRWVERRGKAWQAWYRLVYVAFSCLTLLPILWFSTQLPQHQLPLAWKGLQVVQSILLCYAALMFIAGSRAYDLSAFFGISQLQAYWTHQPAQEPTFHATGILRHVRHPWYSGGLVLLWGVPGYTDVNLCTRILLTAYLLAGTLLEHRKLKKQFGRQYVEYCRQVPMLIPWKFLSSTGNKKGKVL